MIIKSWIVLSILRMQKYSDTPFNIFNQFMGESLLHTPNAVWIQSLCWFCKERGEWRNKSSIWEKFFTPLLVFIIIIIIIWKTNVRISFLFTVQRLSISLSEKLVFMESANSEGFLQTPYGDGKISQTVFKFRTHFSHIPMVSGLKETSFARI